MIAALFLPLAFNGCARADVDPAVLADDSAAKRGRQAADRLGCGACHAIPGIDWPKGNVGPDLDGFADRTLIGGRLPNRPAELAAFVRDAPAYLPGTGMPAIAMNDGDAADIAAFLMTLDGER